MRESSRKLTLETFFHKTYLPAARARKRSWDHDRLIFARHVENGLGRRALSRIAAPHIAEWLAALSERLKPSSCNRILAMLKTVFNFAERMGYISISGNPMRNIRALPCPGRAEVFLTSCQVREVLAELSQRDTIAAKIIMLLIHTGARKSEILGMRWENIDLERGVLVVSLSKSGKPRHIILSPKAVNILQSFEAKPAGFVFPAKGKTGHKSDVFAEWKEVLEKLGLENARLYDLRHTFASLLVNSGHSLYEAQILLGHANPKMTQRYAHLQDQTLRNAVMDVQKAIS